MVEVTWSPEALKAAGWLKRSVAAVLPSMLALDPRTSGAVAEVASIAYDAEAQRVSTDVRITRALDHVLVSFTVEASE